MAVSVGRFWVFKYPNYYPWGGMKDLIAIVDSPTMHMAKEFCFMEEGFSGHIVDIKNIEVVFQWSHHYGEMCRGKEGNIPWDEFGQWTPLNPVDLRH